MGKKKKLEVVVVRRKVEVPPTPELANHQPVRYTPDGKCVTLNWYPDFLLTRDAINEFQHEAIARLYKLWFNAGRPAIRSFAFERFSPSTGDTYSERRAQAMQGYMSAMGTLDPWQKAVIQFTCLHEQGTLESWDSIIQRRKGTAAETLHEGLNVLCRHWRMW